MRRHVPQPGKPVEPEAMSFLNWFRKRRFNPTKDWPPASGLLPPLQIEPFQFGEIRFGSGVEAARPFGRADQVNCYRYPGTFDLTWRMPPLRLSFEDNAFVEVVIPTGFGSLNGARDGAPLSVVRLAGGAVWDNGTTAVAVGNFLGQPETTESFEDGEKWLVYRFSDHFLQLEFNRDDCLAAVSMYVDD